MEGAPVHSPQLDGSGGHNGGGPRRLEQQGGVSKHPPRLHVDLDLATLNLQTQAGGEDTMGACVPRCGADTTTAACQIKLAPYCMVIAAWAASTSRGS